VGSELRQARIEAGLSIRVVAESAGISGPQISRIERGLVATCSIAQLARIGAVVGLDVRVRSYPGSDALRDAGQVRVIERLRPKVHAGVSIRVEVPLPIVGDRRAWDMWLGNLVDELGRRRGMPAEVETRVGDAQAQMRRLTLKMRDAEVEHLLLVVADTPANRRAVVAAWTVLDGMFPISARKALAALAAGHYPGGSSLIFI
jgi:transcriptional regulator with XRE-family HTH domain